MGKHTVPCTHCGKPVEVESVEERDLKDIFKEIAVLIPRKDELVSAVVEKIPKPEKVDLSAVSFDFSPLLEQIKQIQPTVSCKEHPELCAHAEELKTTKARYEELQNSHAILTPEYLEQQESCPNCKKGLDEYVERKFKSKGLVESPKIAKVKDDEEKEEVMPWKR